MNCRRPVSIAGIARCQRQRLIGAMLLAATWTAVAEYAVVYTKDGKSYEGDVRLSSNALQVAGTPLRLEQIKRARFLPAAPAPVPVATTDPAKRTAPVSGEGGRRRALLPTSESGGQPWRRTTTRPPEDWVKPEFNHSGWDRVLGGFGEPNTPHGAVRTVWKTSDIWIRRKFSLDRVPSDPRLRIYHDEHASVFINGRKANEFASYSEGYTEQPLEGEARRSLRAGENLIAIHCVNRSGGQYIDAGLYDGPATAEGNREATEPKAVKGVEAPNGRPDPPNRPELDPPADPRLPAGLMLTGGSIVGRRAHSIDETAARFGDRGKGETLSTTGIARILPQPVLPEVLQRLPAGREGVLLLNQEFVDGEFRQLSNGRVQINSVLLGLKNYDVGQVRAIVLREVEPRPARLEIRTKDGSRLRVERCRIEKEGLVIEDRVLAGWKVAAADLTEIRAIE